MDTLTLLALLLLLALLAVSVTSVVNYARADKTGRKVLRIMWRVRLTWHRTAIRCGLFQAEHGAKVGAEVPLVGELRQTRQEKILVPKIRVTPVANGLRIDVKTVGRVGLPAFEKAADDLANAWRVRFVEASPGKPGQLRLRVTLHDALRTKTTLVPSVNDLVDLRSWNLGNGRDGDPVTVRTSDVSGIVASGLSGYGKTTLVYQYFARLAPSPLVQFALIDGKEYELSDLKERAYLHCGDDIAKGHAVVSEVHTLYTERKTEIRSALHRRNFWDGQPTEDWPLVVMIMDEAHTFLNETKFKDKANQDRDNLVRDIIWKVDELVRKGRTVGIQTMLLTQKPTGEAIPTKIRDNCQIAMSFAQRSKEAAVAALGDDIADYPHAHPRRLQDPAYIGVLSVVAEGRPGFTLVRVPRVLDRDAIALAHDTAHLTRDPRESLRARTRSLQLVEDAPAA